MAVYSYGLIDTLVTGGGTLSFNDATGDSWIVAPERCSGLGLPKVRAGIYNRGQTDGYLFPGEFMLEGRRLLIAGTIRIESASTEAAVLAAREAMCATADAACRSILATEGTLNFVGGSSLAVRAELFEPVGAWLKSFVLGLVSTSSA